MLKSAATGDVAAMNDGFATEKVRAKDRNWIESIWRPFSCGLDNYSMDLFGVPIFESSKRFLPSDRQPSCAVGFRQGALVSEVASVKATNAEMKQLIAALQEKSDKQVNMPAI